MLVAELSLLWWRNSGFNFQALKLILQPGSDDELEANHYENSNKRVDDEDFAEDLLKINGNPQYETNNDSELNDKPGDNDGGGENCFVYIFESSQKACQQHCWQTRKFQ